MSHTRSSGSFDQTVCTLGHRDKRRADPVRRPVSRISAGPALQVFPEADRVVSGAGPGVGPMGGCSRDGRHRCSCHHLPPAAGKYRFNIQPLFLMLMQEWNVLNINSKRCILGFLLFNLKKTSENKGK